MAYPWKSLLLLVILFQYAAANSPMENGDLFEGDIAGIDPNAFTDRNAVVSENQLWTNGVVYYQIDYKLLSITDIIMAAFKEFESKTCLKFKPKTIFTKDYVKLTSISGCWSFVGRQGGEQLISLIKGCFDRVAAVHEIGHAVGLWHEHSRSDRDDYLEILWDNIRPGAEQNFMKLKPWENNLLDEKFDYKSVMLYGEYAFSKSPNVLMTMRAKEEGVVIGLVNNKPGLSDSDVRRINKLYECFGNKRPEPLPVPDFKCDFEVDMCGFYNEKPNANTQWKMNNGTLGGRTGGYVSVKATDDSLEPVRLLSPFFQSLGRKKACLKFDFYMYDGGAVSLDITMITINSSKLLKKLVKKKDEWQSEQIGINLESDVVFSFGALTRKSDGEGLIAVDNILYQLRECD